MGCKVRDLSEEGAVSSSSSLSDALLFTTMCIIGLPVEVQVKDGSVYSGIFHTACVEKDYGIILKKAKMTKKGKQDAKLANGSIIDTLVVLSGDLVQVIAKGVMLPADGIVGNIIGEDVEAANGSVRPSECPENELKVMKSSKAAPAKRKQIRSSNQNKNKNGYGSTHVVVGEGQIIREAADKSVGSAVEVENSKVSGLHSTKIEEASVVPVITVEEGQVRKDKSQGENNGSCQKFEARKDETLHGQRSTSDASLPQLESVSGRHVEILTQMSSDGKSSGSHAPSRGKPEIHDCERPTVTDISSDAPEVSAASTTVVDITSESRSNQLVSSNVAIASRISNSSSKEFKLNPGAQTFSPIFVPRAAAPPAAATVTSMAYIQNRPTVVPVATPQSETGINPFTHQPIKFVHYNNLVAVNDITGSQYPQPIVGHVGSRPQTVRYAGHYAPLQAGPTYVHPNPQSVMVSRLGQLVYVHPVSHDVIQSSTTPPAHSLFAHPQAHLPKQQGIAAAAAQGMQICVTPPPYIASIGQQPLTLPVHVPLSQPPFPTVRPIPVPGLNSHFVSKFI